MISRRAVILACVVLAVCHGSTIENVDRVLQKLGSELSNSKASGNASNLDKFLNHSVQFKNFVVKYEKEYQSDAEIVERFDIFRNNLKDIDFIQEKELGTAKYGVNFFSDLTIEEFNGGKPPRNYHEIEENSNAYNVYRASNISAKHAKRLNYKEMGFVLEKVQNQGHCGSCWAHASTAVLECMNAIENHELIELSKQQLIDCDDSNNGCHGGNPSRAFEYIRDVGGLMMEEDYEQTGYEGICKFRRNKAEVNVEDIHILDSRHVGGVHENMEDYKSYLNEHGPLAVSINAKTIKNYEGGLVYQPPEVCINDFKHLSHDVLLVGYDEEVIDGKLRPYWIIKNSWGPHWGEKGYMRILRGKNVCGIERKAYGATVE